MSPKGLLLDSVDRIWVHCNVTRFGFFLSISMSKIKLSLFLSLIASVALFFIVRDFFVNRSIDVVIPKPDNGSSERLLYKDVNTMEQKTAFKETPRMERKNVPVPTNQWFSSVAFSKTSEPLFAFPLAVKMNTDGFGISYPTVVSTPDAVFASYDPDMRVVFTEGDLESSIVSHDDLSVEIAQKSSGGGPDISGIRVTHGSPFVFGSVAPERRFSILPVGFEVLEKGDNFILFSARGKTFAFFFRSEDMTVDVMADGRGIAAASSGKESEFSIAVLPDRSDLEIFRKYAFDPVIGTKVFFDVEKQFVKSRFDVKTRSGNETLYALLSERVAILDGDKAKDLRSVGGYDTLRGRQSLYEGNSFPFSREIPVLAQGLDIASLTDSEKESLRGFVRDDVRSMSVTEEDTYFLGKKLFALANMLDMSERLGMAGESNAIRSKLKTELEAWRVNTDDRTQKKKRFYYDPVVRGIVGETPSFGSEVFNDHHFHYGYFIYAASILSRYDREYLSANKEFINLLVKDIANNDPDDKTFPYLRVFDSYEGHSWASGQGLFADGNNQESTSEAVNAWYALYLWSDVIGNERLRETAIYLYSEESASALEYWLNIDRSDSRFANFKHAFVSLLWGGKLDASTWFSSRPEARLGIQLIPASPGSAYLGSDKERARLNMMSEKELRNPTMFKDYLAMYVARYDISEARRMVDALKPSDIDGANSRSFMEAFLMTLGK